ncbi:hypothetical protein Clacol_010344 [Clathrus columnatus]|uniref:Uncharacterized protein n=1 Tax=Clathrus columnatus TaxID=1419009 RepID=A0AAV5ANK8_9AGAM|nr:hypothetical protein Clacol_010344 [Clathrus columnatus]
MSVLSRPTVVSHKREKRDVDPNLVPELGLQAGLNPTDILIMSKRGTNQDSLANKTSSTSSQPQLTPQQSSSSSATTEKPSASPSAPAPSSTLAIDPALIPESNRFKTEFVPSLSANVATARITAVTITIQNLDGPGKGCPIASTTLTELETGSIPGFNGFKIPCQCPPITLLNASSANVAAGHAANNSSVAISFSTGKVHDLN